MLSMIRFKLKQIGILRAANSWLKSRQTVSRYRRTVAHYAHLEEAPISDAWRVRAQALSRSAKDPDLRIFFIGTDEQQDKSGFLQALERLGETRCFFREDGSWGHNDPAPYWQRRERNTRRLEQLFADNASGGWIPQMLIAQTWGCLIEPTCFSRLRDRYGVFVVNIAMDDRHQYWGSKVSGVWDGTYPLIPHIDLTLTAAPEAVDWYRKEGGVAMYFPEASDPEIFHSMPDLPKIHDVSFVGSRYGIREKVVAALHKADIQVTAYGSGWSTGRIANEEIPRLFAQSRIVLGVSAIGHCPNFTGLKLRDFDAPMSGSCYLTQHNDDLHGLYDIGREIDTFHSVVECVERVRYLLAHNAEREAIAAAGRTRAVRDHTWDVRLRTMWSHLGLETS